MKKYRYNWRVFLGAGIMLILFLCIFLPAFSVSGEKYIDAAIDADRLAVKEDETMAVSAGAADMVTDYGKSGDDRRGKIREYDNEIDNRIDHAGISALFFSRWALRVTDTLYFDGITYEDGKYIEDSGVVTAFRLAGWLMLIPPISALVFMIYMICCRRTFSAIMIIHGCITVVAMLIYRFAIPAMIWDDIKGMTKSFSLIPEGALSIDGVGDKMIRGLWYRLSGPSWICMMIVGIVCIILGILFVTVFRKKLNHSIAVDPFVQTEWRPEPLHERPPEVQKTPQGTIVGMTGQYVGQSIRIEAGEEIILGRDPQYCMLIFDNPKISRRQCGIRYDGIGYLVVDYSTNGTRLYDGTVLSTSTYTRLKPGTILYLGTQEESFRLA